MNIYKCYFCPVNLFFDRWTPWEPNKTIQDMCPNPAGLKSVQHLESKKTPSHQIDHHVLHVG